MAAAAAKKGAKRENQEFLMAAKVADIFREAHKVVLSADEFSKAMGVDMLPAVQARVDQLVREAHEMISQHQTTSAQAHPNIYTYAIKSCIAKYYPINPDFLDWVKNTLGQRMEGESEEVYIHDNQVVQTLLTPTIFPASTKPTNLKGMSSHAWVAKGMIKKVSFKNPLRNGLWGDRKVEPVPQWIIDRCKAPQNVRDRQKQAASLAADASKQKATIISRDTVNALLTFASQGEALIRDQLPIATETDRAKVVLFVRLGTGLRKEDWMKDIIATPIAPHRMKYNKTSKGDIGEHVRPTLFDAVLIERALMVMRCSVDLFKGTLDKQMKRWFPEQSVKLESHNTLRGLFATLVWERRVELDWYPDATDTECKRQALAHKSSDSTELYFIRIEG